MESGKKNKKISQKTQQRTTSKKTRDNLQKPNK
jgi:hypothetical protein